VPTFRDKISAIPPTVKQSLKVRVIAVPKRRYRANILSHANAKTNVDIIYTAAGAWNHPKICFLLKDGLRFYYSGTNRAFLIHNDRCRRLHRVDSNEIDMNRVEE